MTEQETETTSGTPSDKISMVDLVALKIYRNKWIESQQLEKFNRDNLNKFKSDLYNKYNLIIDDYFIDGETGAIKKRRVRKD